MWDTLAEQYSRQHNNCNNSFSLTFPIFPDFTLTIFQFPDFSRFSRRVATLFNTQLLTIKTSYQSAHFRHIINESTSEGSAEIRNSLSYLIHCEVNAGVRKNAEHVWQEAAVESSYAVTLPDFTSTVQCT